MKSVIAILFAFVSFNVSAEYLDARLVFADGSTKKGLVESPFGGDYIFYKTSKDVKAEKIEAEKINSIIFTVKGEEREFHRLKTYLGWGQKRVGDPVWLKVILKGIVTLYVSQTTLSTPSNTQNSAGFLDYYCIREGEPAAKWVSAVSTLNNNQHFRAKAPHYFEDYPELAAKIKSKEYTWKDLELVVQEYNKWAAKK